MKIISSIIIKFFIGLSLISIISAASYLVKASVKLSLGFFLILLFFLCAYTGGILILAVIKNKKITGGYLRKQKKEPEKIPLDYWKMTPIEPPKSVEEKPVPKPELKKEYIPDTEFKTETIIPCSFCMREIHVVMDKTSKQIVGGEMIGKSTLCYECLLGLNEAVKNAKKNRINEIYQPNEFTK